MTTHARCHEARLTIAGVRFSMTSEAAIADVSPSPAYTAFTGPSQDSPDIEVPVALLPEPVEGLAGFDRQFDAEDMWSLFRDGATRYITHMGWGLEAPLWSAELPLDASAVRLHCGGVLVRREGDTPVISSPLRYPLDQLLLTYVLARREGAIVHSAAIEWDGRLWLLAGRSGAGKSTAAALLRGRAGVALVSDDRIVVRRQEGTVNGFGTPWPGEARVAANRQARLGGILFLVQSDVNRIAPVTAGEALERLLPVVSVPWYEPELFPEVLSFCGDVAESVPVHTFQFRPDAEAAEVLTDFLAAC